MYLYCFTITKDYFCVARTHVGIQQSKLSDIRHPTPPKLLGLYPPWFFIILRRFKARIQSDILCAPCSHHNTLSLANDLFCGLFWHC